MLHDMAMGLWEFSTSFCVGRSRGCEVSIATSEETRTVSKRHVSIVPLTETLNYRAQATTSRRRWLVYDLETMNGTAVNGVELAKGGNQELQCGDEVVLASAMRQCVRILVQFSDEAHSRITVKALASSVALSPSPLHHRISTERASPCRSPRGVVPNASFAATGFRRSAVTIAGSPALTRTACQSLANTPNSGTNDQTLPLNLLQKRNRSSPNKPSSEIRNVVRNRQQNTPTSQLRKRSRRGIAYAEEAVVDKEASTIVKKVRENEKEEQERLMMCSVCLEYYYCSATLPCSHTFCGHCISSWFRNSLSCPECRDVVKSLPVRNRALDELVERLVGHKETYKSLVRRRARMQRRLIEPTQSLRGRDVNEDESEGATRGLISLQIGNRCTQELRVRSNVFTHWSVEEKLAFSACINEQFGEVRVLTCKKVGLTENAVNGADLTALLVAAQNLLLDCSGLRLVGDECGQRLKIFLFFG